jgi:serine protease Do
MNKGIIVFVLALFLIIQGQLIGIVPTLNVDTFKTDKSRSEPAKFIATKSTESVVQQALPSVVTIKLIKLNEIIDEDTMSYPFPRFYHNPESEETENNIGSGFVIAADGIVVTSKHVVSEDAEYAIITNDGKEYRVTNIYNHPTTDLAILETDGLELTPLSLGNSSQLELGEQVYAIGTPLGEFTNSVTSGIISGLGRGITAGSPFEDDEDRLENLIQTDAAINPGNSGGPLINSSGEVIGINTAGTSDSQNISFAIPVNVIRDFLSIYRMEIKKS